MGSPSARRSRSRNVHGDSRRRAEEPGQPRVGLYRPGAEVDAPGSHPEGVHVLGEGHQLLRHPHLRARHEHALAVDAAKTVLGDELVDGLPDGRPRHPEPLAHLALGRDGRVHRQPVLFDHVQQDGAELKVLWQGPGGIDHPSCISDRRSRPPALPAASPASLLVDDVRVHAECDGRVRVAEVRGAGGAGEWCGGVVALGLS
jgi:hypothetical protein